MREAPRKHETFLDSTDSDASEARPSEASEFWNRSLDVAHSKALRDIQLNCWRIAFKTPRRRNGTRTHISVLATFGPRGTLEEFRIQIAPEANLELSDCVEQQLRLTPFPYGRYGDSVPFELQI